jgi:hypothetical protein
VNVERRAPSDRDDVVERRVDEHADQLRRTGRTHGGGDRGRAIRRQVALRARPEVEAEVVNAGLGDPGSVVGLRDAADLDPDEDLYGVNFSEPPREDPHGKTRSGPTALASVRQP